MNTELEDCDPDEVRTMSLDETEDLANKQFDIQKGILESLETASGTPWTEIQGYYWWRSADRVVIDRWGSLSLWSYGCRGSSDERLDSFELQPLMLQGKVDEFTTQFRAELLPKFNDARRVALARKKATIAYEQAQLSKFEGDIT